MGGTGSRAGLQFPVGRLTSMRPFGGPFGDAVQVFPGGVLFKTGLTEIPAGPRSALVRASMNGDQLVLSKPRIHESLVGKLGVTTAAVVGGILIGALVFR